MATGGGVIRLWDTTTGKLIKAFGEDQGYMYNKLEWPALDGPMVSLETSFENPGFTVLRIWDVESGTIRAEFRGTQP